MDLAEYDSEGIPRWKIPFAGKETGDATRCVDGTCAICMGTYICGDEVIWSSNPNCPHVYHEACLSLWLSQSHKECPCCRQQFLLTE
jgi:Ring finger domain